MNSTPCTQEIFAKFPARYYWSAYQSEWATDVVFRDTAALQRLYPMWVHHGHDQFLQPRRNAVFWVAAFR